MIGCCPRPVIDCKESEAMLQKSEAVKSELGSMTPRRWCGKRVAKSIESFDLPVPVAPRTTTTFSFCRGI
ncbi:hypothetical protein Leryth_005519 [Lithospermum erythrorhizon]|nr:hypothetical protein Leryth_005519 [Lithospermum erythrorhizon]